MTEYKQPKSALYDKFNSATSYLRYRAYKLSKEEQKDLAYDIKECQDYGFVFFAGHYLYDTVGRIIQKAKDLGGSF